MRRVRLVVVVVLGLVAAAVAGAIAFQRMGGMHTPELTVTWGGTEGHPSCVYRQGDETVIARLTMFGGPPPSRKVTIRVTVYADENTSVRVGSYAETVRISDSARRSIVVTVPVDRPPHVDEDGEAACRLDVRK